MRVGLEPTQLSLLAPEASALTARPSHPVLDLDGSFCGHKIYILKEFLSYRIGSRQHQVSKDLRKIILASVGDAPTNNPLCDWPPVIACDDGR